MHRPRMVSGARALRRGAVRHATSTLLKQRERGCCERGTLRGPFVFESGGQPPSGSHALFDASLKQPVSPFMVADKIVEIVRSET